MSKSTNEDVLVHPTKYLCPPWCETGWEAGHHDGEQRVAHVLPIGEGVWLWSTEDRVEDGTFTPLTIGVECAENVTPNQARALAESLVTAANRLELLAADGVQVIL